MRLLWKQLKTPFPSYNKYPQEKSGSLFTIKKSLSKRFFQLSFEGFRPRGKNPVEQFVNSWKEFLKTLFLYLIKKVGLLISSVFRTFVMLINIPKRLKLFVATKLIWSRGKLAKPIVTGVVMAVAFSIFSLGEIFFLPYLVNKLTNFFIGS